jgi:pimeloyl-ACP methyl ester carboxylesterase
VDCRGTTATSDAVFQMLEDGVAGIGAQVRTATAGAKHPTRLRMYQSLRAAGLGCSQLVDADVRRAFLDTVRGILDVGGQRVSANDRLYLAGELPTLIVWGERDPLIPVKHAHAAHERIPESRLEVFPHAGHFPHRDEPRRFVELLLDFLEKTQPARLSETLLQDRLRVTARA